MADVEERFDVVFYDEEGYWDYSGRDLDARAAVELAKRVVDLADNPAIHSDIERVLITDSDDFTVFLWERGKGVVFPKPEEAR